MKQRWLGIDPGKTGALASITEHGGQDSIEFYDVALIKVKDAKFEYNEADMAQALWRLVSLENIVKLSCVLEKVGAMPGQGVTSMFSFGMGYGLWRGMLAAYQVPFSLVRPATWKKKLMPDMEKEKSAALQRAIQLYPQVADQLTRVKDIGRADALLLAHYARHFND